MADSYTPKEGTCNLFKNKQKEKDTHPDERGDAMIGGVIYEIAAWIKTDRNGAPFRSLSIKPKRERPQADSGAAYRAGKDGGAPHKPADDFDDPLPF